MALGGGFFHKEMSQSLKTSGRLDSGKPATCASCGLYKNVSSPRMAPFGEFKKKILNIGEAPGAEEDKRGRQWQGKVGQRLQREYRALGFDLFKDCLNINAVNCRPTDGNANRTPTGREIACCRARVMKTIKENSPKVIVLVGEKAVESIIGTLWKKDLGGISKWRGFAIPDQTLRAWICPVWHPSYLERNQDSPEMNLVWRRDLKNALNMIHVPFPDYSDAEKRVRLPNEDEVESILARILKSKTSFSFDYETTGRKPHAEGHQIVCVSLCFSEEEAYAFPLPKERSRSMKLWKRVLSDSRIPKEAFNMKFEHTWTEILLKTEIKGWSWDAMLASHILDNRPGICSLKFQTYVNFGVAGYDEEVEPYLKSTSKDGNALNRIKELWEDSEGRKKLMIYCGMDSLFTYKLGKIQKSFLQKGD